MTNGPAPYLQTAHRAWSTFSGGTPRCQTTWLTHVASTTYPEATAGGFHGSLDAWMKQVKKAGERVQRGQAQAAQ